VFTRTEVVYQEDVVSEGFYLVKEGEFELSKSFSLKS